MLWARSLTMLVMVLRVFVLLCFLQNQKIKVNLVFGISTFKNFKQNNDLSILKSLDWGIYFYICPSDSLSVGLSVCVCPLTLNLPLIFNLHKLQCSYLHYVFHKSNIFWWYQLWPLVTLTFDPELPPLGAWYFTNTSFF